MKALAVLTAAAALVSSGVDARPSKALKHTSKVSQSSAAEFKRYLEDKEAGRSVTDPELSPALARNLMAASLAKGGTEIFDGLEGCKLGNAARAWEGGQQCYLSPQKLYSVTDAATSTPQLEKRVIQAGHPLRFAARGPSTAESSANLRLSLHEGEVESVTAIPKLNKLGKGSSEVQASMSTDEDKDEITVSLPFIPGQGEEQEWEIVVKAAASSSSSSSSPLADGQKDDGHRHFHALAVEQKRQALDQMEKEEEDASNSAVSASSSSGSAVVSLTFTHSAATSTSTSTKTARSLSQSQQTPTPTLLADGITVQSSVPSQGWQYYSFNQPLPLSERVDIEVTSISGDADLYVTLNGNTPTRFAYQYYSAAVFGADSVIIRPNDTMAQQYCGAGVAGSSCPITIGVYGWLAANYTISATTSGGITRLIPGLPFLDTILDAGAYNYYQLDTDSQASKVTIAVTPLSGDPDIVVSNSQFVANGTGSTRPKIEAGDSYCAYSNYGRRDVVELYPGDPCYCTQQPCHYYIGVQAYGGPATFSIVGSELANPTYTLLDGLPMAGLLPQGETDLFLFTVQFPANDPSLPASRRVIEIITQSFLGDADVFVTLDGRRPGPNAWDYRAIGAGGVDAIAIRASDPVFMASPCGPAVTNNGACTLQIAAYAFTSTIYSIVATSGRYIQLIDGQPQTDSVDARSYSYYRFFVGAPQQLVQFTVQPSSGDPDLYCGSDANANTTVPTTTRGTYIWRSISMGLETLQISPDDPGACTPPCSYYCAVYGYRTNATYVITGSTSSAAPTRLIIGQPQGDVVAERTYRRYVAEFNGSALVVTVAPTSGDPDLYINLGSNAANRPTISSYQYASMSGLGIDSITVEPTDAAYIQNCSAQALGPNAPSHGLAPNCEAQIAVYGWGASEYTITASVDSSILFDGIPAYGSVGRNSYTFFRYTATSPMPLTISVASLSGDPDLFVSTTNQRPNVTDRQWYSNSVSGMELVYIDPSVDSKAQACGMPCTYYIGILGWAGAASFTVTASTSQISDLLPGLPQRSFAPAWAFRYFTFVVPAPDASGQPPAQPIEFSATPLSGGDISLYVNNVVFPGTGVVQLPTLSCSPSTCASWTVTNSIWSSFNSPTRERVFIDTSDPNYAPGTYVVGVLSLGQDADFSITGNLQGNLVTVQDGIPYEDFAPYRTYNYYRLILDTYGADVSIVVTPIAGDPDLYCSKTSTNQKPSRTNFDKSSTGSRVADAVYFQWRELTECQRQIDPTGHGGDCDIYIAVYGYSNATYTLTATVVDGTQRTMLLDGVQQGGSVAYRSYQYYYAPVNVPRGQTYSVYVRSVSGDADVYVRLDGQTPSNTFFQYSSTRMSGDEVINITPSSAYYNSTATMTIAVYGFSTANYTITFATSAAVVQLADGAAQSGTVPGLGTYYSYYYVSVPGPGTDVTLSLTALSGDPDIFVDQWKFPTYRPSVTSFKWSGTYFGSDAVYIGGLTDPNACTTACNYIVAVTCAMGISCRFTLTATISPFTLIQLVDGQPISSATVDGGFKYFSLDMGSDASIFNLTLAAVSIQGDVQLYVTNLYEPGDSPVGTLPSNEAGGYIWSSARGGSTTGSGVVTIPFNDPWVRPDASFYTIAAFCVTGPCTFTITASSSFVPLTLIPGQPTQELTLAGGNTGNFNVPVTDTTADLIVVATAVDGNVVVAIAPPTATSLPTCSQDPTSGQVTCAGAVWIGTAGGTANQVRISASSPCSGPYVAPGATCNPSLSWVAGQYQIAVFSVMASSAPAATFSVTAYASSALLRLVDGQPQASQTSSNQPPVFVFQSQYNAALPDIRISVVNTGASMGLVLYVTSCVENACTPADSLPGPNSFDLVATIDPSTAWDLFVTKYMSGAYCSDAQHQGTCNYFASVYPASSCESPACTASFSIVGQEQGGSLSKVTFFSINNKILTQPGSVTPGKSAGYELYLQPPAGGATINARLEACGPGTPSLYVCDPSSGAAKKCNNPFQPSKTDNSGSSSTSLNGVAMVGAKSVTATNFFVAVAADSSSSVVELNDARALQSAPAAWGYTLLLSTGSSATLYPGAPLTLNLDTQGTTVNVTWAPATIGTTTQPGTKPARGVSYIVYAAQDGFRGSVSSLDTTVVPTTPCGLIRWASLVASLPSASNNEAPIAVANQTFATFTNLQPETSYEFNVLALCDRTCWLLNYASADAEGKKAIAAAFRSSRGLAAAAAAAAQEIEGPLFTELELQEAERTYADRVAKQDEYAARFNALSPKEKLETALRLAAAGPDGDGSYAPGYDVQRVAYSVTPGATGAAGSAPTNKAFPVAGIVGITLSVLAAAGGAFVFYRYKRRRVEDSVGQYQAMNPAFAMDTISTPAGPGAGAGSINGAAEGGSGYVRSQPGIFARIQDWGASSSRRSGAGASSGGRTTFPGLATLTRPSQGLAESSYSELDDRANSFL